jgi:Ca2+/H+ antiporter
MPLFQINSSIIGNKIVLYKKEISMVLLIICIIVVVIVFKEFNEDQKLDGSSNLLITTFSYITTTISLIATLLILTRDQ